MRSTALTRIQWEWNFQLPFYHIPSWIHRENGVPQNKKPKECIMQLENRIITSKELKLSYAMNTNHWQDFSMERTPTTK